MSDERRPIEIFYAYSHRDELLRDELDAHLSMLKRQQRISVWHDRKIEPGHDWAAEISAHVESAQIILLLVSADFVASEYCYGIELERAVQRHSAGDARVIPIILRPVVWSGTLFGKLQALPHGGTPISTWGDQDSAFADVVKGIREIVDGLTDDRTLAAAHVPPAICNVGDQHGYFTGREAILTDLRTALVNSQGRQRIQVLHGLSGVGKTRLATEYVVRHGTEYDLTWRLRASEPSRLADDFAAIAGPLRLPVPDSTDIQAICEAVRRWLTEHDRWLLLFDDAGKPADIVPYLPAEVRGHVLVTSLNPGWRQIGTPRPVYHLDRDASIQFLLERTGHDDHAGASRLADLLGGLPLALEQAAAYIETYGTDFGGYLRLFEERRSALWQQEKPPDDYSNGTVAVTLALAIEQVQQSQPVAVDLLRLYAHFAPDDIPIWLIRDGAEHLPGPLRKLVEDELAWNEAVALLRRYSLVEVSSETLSLNQLVQLVVRDLLAIDAQNEWARVAVSLMRAAFPAQSGDVRTWDRCASLLTHALAAVDHAVAHGVELSRAAEVLNRCGGYARAQGRFAEALDLCQRALQIAESVHDPNHMEVAAFANNLGSILQDLGDLGGAQKYIERALQINTATHGANHPEVAISINNLGSVLRALGNLAGARSHFERSLGIAEIVDGVDHPRVAAMANNLAGVLKEMGDIGGARTHYERALRINEAAYGLDHPEVAIVLNNLGTALRSQGDASGARAYYERALQIDESAYGPDHPNVAIRLSNLGAALLALGDMAGARAHVERALRIAERSYGPDHPTTATIRANLEALG